MEKADNGFHVAVGERRPSQELHGARALGISSRTIEVFDQRGIAERFRSAGQPAQVEPAGQLMRPPGMVMVPQPFEVRSRSSSSRYHW